MGLALPDYPGPNEAVPEMRVFGGVITPPKGGASQNLRRLGSRYAMRITLPRMKPEPHGRLWASALSEAMEAGEAVEIAFPQPGLEIGNPGAAAINGAGQSGSVLNLKGMTPGYTIRKGQFFHFSHNGRKFLHSANEAKVVSGTGIVQLPIKPMLRVSPGDSVICEFVEPMIEGFLEGNRQSWTQQRARTVGLSFTIFEVE